MTCAMVRDHGIADGGGQRGVSPEASHLTRSVGHCCPGRSGTGRAGGEMRVSKCVLAKRRSAQVITSRTLRAV